MKCGFIYIILIIGLGFRVDAQSFITTTNEPGSFAVADCVILIDLKDEPLVKKSAELLQEDILQVTGYKPPIVTDARNSKAVIIIGTINSIIYQKSGYRGKLNIVDIRDKWETYHIRSARNIATGITNALMIIGSDRRGVAYGVLELSKQLGVSPWYWWADVPIKKNPAIRISGKINVTDHPRVKYRGIFINDEAPALSNWSREKFGGFNHKFYNKVFELMLRLKSNYIWPAMWGNAFYDDDSLNICAAEEYGIVIGTSHHEPLMRAHDEWRRYGNKQKWNYDTTKKGLQDFWKTGMQRASNEKIVTLGMRGDGDEPMSRETATNLLERIVKDQRKIIEDVTKKPAEQTPQLWVLYKEVQDYYDKGMRVPDDVTLLLCDDNWGNIRRLPLRNEKPRKGGYGIYYHFDYVGGPRNYKWVNTNPIPRIWEQMHLAWEYNARQIWIVNVGDIKPMEFPISFFLDYAWDPEKMGADDLQKYTEKWAADQFGAEQAGEIADIISKYLKYNSRRKPELLNENTYELPEFFRVTEEYNQLLVRTTNVLEKLDPVYADAYYQLVLHPVKACSNLYALYLATALNHAYGKLKWKETNDYAVQVKSFYKNDSLITLEYHNLKNGKWNHMMSQTHIGYTYWQQPATQKMPELIYIPADSIVKTPEAVERILRAAAKPAKTDGRNLFYELDSMVSFNAANYSRAINKNGIKWTKLPDHGRTGDAITPFPVTALPQQPGKNGSYLEYEFYTFSWNEFKVNAYFSPTLNIHNSPEGLRYAISVDDEAPQIISINKEDKTTGTGIWSKWVSENIIIRTTNHIILKPGKHILKYWMVDTGVVLQQLVAAFSERPSYLGPVETRIIED